MGQILGLCSQTPLGELATLPLPERMKIDAKESETYEIWAYKSALMVSWIE